MNGQGWKAKFSAVNLVKARHYGPSTSEIGDGFVRIHAIIVIHCHFHKAGAACCMHRVQRGEIEQIMRNA